MNEDKVVKIGMVISVITMIVGLCMFVFSNSYVKEVIVPAFVVEIVIFVYSIIILSFFFIGDERVPTIKSIKFPVIVTGIVMIVLSITSMQVVGVSVLSDLTMLVMAIINEAVLVYCVM